MQKILVALLLLASAGGGAMAQCGPCAIGDTCTVDPPFPTVCPVITPAGTVGVPFAFDVTFWIPPSFAEPTTGLNVVIDQIVLNSIENLPLGLTYEASSPDLTYYPQVDPFGCVRVCGIPMEAGADTLIVNATMQGTVGGIATTQAQQLNIPIFANPASEDSVADFTATALEGCEPQTVTFLPAITSPPGLNASYDWDFGNGNIHVGATPPAQTYNAGDYEVSLQTTISGVFLTQLTISDINEDWCGDIDEPDLPIVGCVGQPDLYFTVLDAQLGLSRSSVASNTQSNTWNGLAMPLGFPPFTLTVYDEDGLSDDDVLGTFTFDASTGTFPFSGGGTSGQRTVQVQTVGTFNYADTINVLPAPNTTLALVGNTLCAADQNLSTYVWSFNGVVLPFETGPCVLASNGAWSVVGTSAAGCSSTSTFQAVDVGMGETSMERTVIVHPVPNTGVFTLRSSGWNGSMASLEVMDATGRTIHAEQFPVNGALLRTIDLGGVAEGSYVLRLSDGRDRVVRSFIVEPR